MLTIGYRDEAERPGLGQAIAFFTRMRGVAKAARGGTALAACEPVTLQDRRALPCHGLAAAVRARRPARGGGTSARP